jgi:F0F1-type ATP synthase delta subunit
MIRSKQLASVLQLMLRQTKDVRSAVDRFVSYCEKRKLTHLLPMVVKHMEYFEEKEKQRNTVIITSKHPLSETELKKIIAVSGSPKDARVYTNLDDKILGGFKAQYDYRMYDASVRTAISKLTHSFK